MTFPELTTAGVCVLVAAVVLTVVYYLMSKKE